MFPTLRRRLRDFLRREWGLALSLIVTGVLLGSGHPPVWLLALMLGVDLLSLWDLWRRPAVRRVARLLSTDPVLRLVCVSPLDHEHFVLTLNGRQAAAICWDRTTDAVVTHRLPGFRGPVPTVTAVEAPDTLPWQS